jgi:hypothetical protein
MFTLDWLYIVRFTGEYGLSVESAECTLQYSLGERTEKALSSTLYDAPFTSPTIAVGRARATAGTPDGGDGTNTELEDVIPVVEEDGT